MAIYPLSGRENDEGEGGLRVNLEATIRVRSHGTRHRFTWVLLPCKLEVVGLTQLEKDKWYLDGKVVFVAYVLDGKGWCNVR